MPQKVLNWNLAPFKEINLSLASWGFSDIEIYEAFEFSILTLLKYSLMPIPNYIESS